MEGGGGGGGGGEGGERRAAVSVENQKVPFHKLFAFADRFDWAMMVVGTTCALLNGMTQPFMTLIFGDLINKFGSANATNVIHEVSKVRII